MKKTSIIKAIRFALLCYTAYSTGKEIYRYVKDFGDSTDIKDAIEEATNTVSKKVRKKKK